MPKFYLDAIAPTVSDCPVTSKISDFVVHVHRNLAKTEYVPIDFPAFDAKGANPFGGGYAGHKVSNDRLALVRLFFETEEFGLKVRSKLVASQTLDGLIAGWVISRVKPVPETSDFVMLIGYRQPRKSAQKAHDGLLAHLLAKGVPPAEIKLTVGAPNHEIKAWSHFPFLMLKSKTNGQAYRLYLERVAVQEVDYPRKGVVSSFGFSLPGDAEGQAIPVF